MRSLSRMADLDEFLALCRMRQGRDVSDTLRAATRAFLRDAKHDPGLPFVAAERLASLSASGAAWLALALGAAVEGGGDPELTAPAVLAHFAQQLQRLSADPEARASLSDPTSSEPFDQVCQAVVAHLARAPERREALGHDRVLLERLENLEEMSAGATWVRESLLKSSGTLLVLHPSSESGVLVRYENISNCFHLFSLLQAAIGDRLPGGHARPPTAGTTPGGKTGTGDVAWWHYGDPRSPTASFGASIWGEALARSIPTVAGVQTLLLWPPLLAARRWDAAFLEPDIAALPASVELDRVLSTEESREALGRLGIG